MDVRLIKKLELYYHITSSIRLLPLLTLEACFSLVNLDILFKMLNLKLNPPELSIYDTFIALFSGLKDIGLQSCEGGLSYSRCIEVSHAII